MLKRNQRIAARKAPEPQPMERPAPLSHWQIDFKDVSSAPADPDGKQQHVLETCNAVDMGTSLLLSAEVRPDFTAETALLAVAESLRTHGLPEAVTIDRDTLLSSAVRKAVISPPPSCASARMSGSRFRSVIPIIPSKMRLSSAITAQAQSECLALDRPQTLSQAREATARFQTHYNQERPNQALSCGNRPPLQAFPRLPTLPSIPAQVEPDAWLTRLRWQAFPEEG